MPTQLDTYESFDNKVLKAEPGKLVVVDFWAIGCGAFTRFAPTFAAMAEEMTDVMFFKVNACKNTKASKYAEISCDGARCMPTFKIYKDGKCLDTIGGASENDLRASITKHKYLTFS
eukprot:sb/3476556/